jgi:TldD protein
MLGKFRYGPEFMNIQGDRSQPGGCATIGYDDEGVKPDTFLIIKNGLVNDYQTTREQANWLKWWYDAQKKPARSHGCSNADSWGTVQFQRMPNVSLLPGAKDVSYEDIIAATDRGIAIEGDGSFSIDQQRYNAQFGGQVFHEIKGGKIVGQLKDVAYQMRTPDFWNSMDMIGGQKSYFMGGAFNDGKGQPPQSNAVSHGCVPSRFRNINVINTGRKA